MFNDDKSIRHIKTKHGTILSVRETTSLNEMQRMEPLFFKKPHGKRETLDVYRGFLIVRNTVQFTGCKPERKTTVYGWDVVDEYSLCLSSMEGLSSTRNAERFIDGFLERGAE